MLNYLRRFFEFLWTIAFGWIWLVQSINTSSSARHQEKDKSWTLQILCVEDSWETNSLLWKITILIGKSTINGPFFAYQRVIKKTCKMEKVFHMQTTRDFFIPRNRVKPKSAMAINPTDRLTGHVDCDYADVCSQAVSGGWGNDAHNTYL